MITIFWSEAGESAVPTGILPSDTIRWRGVRSPGTVLWLIDGAADDHLIDTLTGQHGVARDDVRTLLHLHDWGTPSLQTTRWANFVLRELVSGSAESFLPPLYEQNEKVVANPGNIGSALYAERDNPDHLLGITHWESEAAFVAYSEWASKHAWKGVVDPLTVGVPLRLFVQRIGDDGEGSI